MLHFDAQKIYSCGKHCEKRRNCLLQAISPFLTMFSSLFGTYFSSQMRFKLSSAICFNLDQSKNLSSGQGLTLYQMTTYWTGPNSKQKTKLSIAKMTISVFDEVVNIVGKGEDASHQHFLFFPQCFQKVIFFVSGILSNQHFLLCPQRLPQCPSG